MRRKHIFALFLCFLMIFALAACGTSAGNTAETDSTAQKAESTSDIAETKQRSKPKISRQVSM